jgi:hypothetical protein
MLTSTARSICLTCAVMLTAAAPRLGAQTADADTTPLPLPARWRALTHVPAPGDADFLAFRHDLEDGRIDPLALLRQVMPRAAAAPQDARYAAACSRERGATAAVFALPGATNADAASALEAQRTALRERGGAAPTSADRARDFANVMRFGSASASDPRVQRAAAFYRKQGFTPLPVRAFVPFSWDRDPAAGRLRVSIWGFAALAGARAYPGCRALGDAPVIVMELGAP